MKCGKNVFRYSPFVLLYDFLILLYIVFLRIIKCRREYITEDGTATSYSHHHKKGWDTTNIREAKYKNTKVNPKDIPVAVYGGHVENSKSDATVDTSLLHSMSQLSTNPNTSYVIETNPNFTNRRNFLSFDYVLSRLKLDPMNIQKRLGDGYYEQQLVMQEIMRQTGKSRLQSGLSAEEQYRQLMDVGLSVTKSQSIALGRGLTEAEQKNLKEDVVLLVSKSVVLPNGKTETVLVPTLYLAPNTKRVEGGTITQTNAAGSTKVTAGRDVINTGVQYEAANSKVEWDSRNNRRETITSVDQGRIGGAGQTTVVAGRDVSMAAGVIISDVNTQVTAGRNVAMKAMNATHELEEHRFDKGKSGGGLIDINASGNMARQNGDTHQESYVPTTIKAAQLAQLKAKRDTTIIGSTVSGKKVEVDTGHDLHMQSLQDVDNFKEHSKSAGFSVSSKPNFKNPTGSISASVGRIDSKWKSVTHQAGIYAGEDGYTLNVGNGTTLEGAVIKSEAPKAKNTLTTKSLEMKDIQNEAEYTYSNNGIGYNYYGSKKKLEEMKTNDKKGYDKIYNNIGLVPNLGVGSKGKANSTTQSAISDGILTVDGKEIDTKTINTNTENTLHQLDKIFDKKKIEERQELARLFAKNAYK